MRGNATWAGDLVGFSLADVVPLTADVGLDYRFATSTLDIAVDNVRVWSEAEWHRIPGRRYGYRVGCDAASCGAQRYGLDIATRFYPRGRDASAYAAGVITDELRPERAYTGAFLAQKD